MDVAQFLDPLRFTPHRKIVIPNLPETPEFSESQFARSDLFEHLHCDRKLPSFRLADEQVYVLRHDHITGNVASIPLPNSL